MVYFLSFSILRSKLGVLIQFELIFVQSERNESNLILLQVDIQFSSTIC